MNLRRMNATEVIDRALVDDILGESAGYNLQTYGALPSAQEAGAFFDAFPDECESGDRLIFAICSKGEVIGLAKIARAYPEPDTALLGLLLIRPAHRRRHVGCQIVEQLSHKARTWTGIHRWQLGVLETNEEAIHFWRHCGFRTLAADCVKPGLQSRGHVMERKIKAKPACRGGKAEVDSAHTQAHARHLLAVLR